MEHWEARPPGLVEQSNNRAGQGGGRTESSRLLVIAVLLHADFALQDQEGRHLFKPLAFHQELRNDDLQPFLQSRRSANPAAGNEDREFGSARGCFPGPRNASTGRHVHSEEKDQISRPLMRDLPSDRRASP